MSVGGGDARHHVVIIGCGFGGLFAARALKRAPVRVTLIDRTNHHLFQPLLYQVATGILSEGQIAPAIRDVLRNYEDLRVILAEVEHVDVDARVVHADEFGRPLTIPYDSLILAGGATTSYFGKDQFRAAASGMKSLDDALALRGQIFGAFELAEAETDAEARRRLMTFVVVGGGPTGVEMAGQLKELSRRALHKNYRVINPRDTRVVLVEGTDRLVASMGPRLSRLTARDLSHMGVEIHLDAMVTDLDERGVEITKQDGTTERIAAATKIWAAGTRASGLGATVADAAGAKLDKTGRVVVEPDCSVPGHPEIFVVGDLMALDDLPGVAEVAMQSGAHAAHTIVRRLEGKGAQAVPLPRPRDAGGDLPLPRRGGDRAAAGGRLRRVGPLARRPHHLSHRLQEPLRCPGPLGGQLRRARPLRAGTDRALGGPDGADRQICLRFRPEHTNRSGRPMPINVTPIAGLSDDINDIRIRTARIVNEKILPNESVLWHARGSNVTDAERAEAKALRQEIQDKVKAEGLWAPHLPPDYGGMGIDFMAHAYMNEILAYAVGAASLFGVVAPNSGNQTILVKYGTEEQKKKWLLPLVEGTMQSGFSMTEPENAGSDPRSIQTTAIREGDEWVINGHKWFTSNGLAADFFIVMCRAKESKDDEGPGRMVQIIVPTSNPGVIIERGIGIWGSPRSDHVEVRYDHVRVPQENLLGQVGDGHRAAQDRLGAGRIFHCMNSVGQMWRAFDLMVERLLSREVHGGLLKDKQFMQGFVADSYMDLQAARLMTIHAAEKVDKGDPQARTEISAIKVFVPAAYSRVVDRAIQVWGAAGVTNDLPLAQMYLGARTLRLADGPDEVHRILIAKNVLHHYENGDSWDFAG